MALARGGQQRLRRPCRPARLLRQKDAEMAADDLVGVVAFDALGAVVPAAHAAFGVEHEDRVIAHVLEQQPIALFGLAQRAFGLLALR